MKEKFILPTDSTLVNVGNSILRFYNTPTFHETFKPLDEVLDSAKKENVCLILFDACGKYIIEKHRDDLPFIYSHKHILLNSTFPPTTVNATTALTTGKYALETGYIGWNQYYEGLGFLDTFASKDKVTKNVYSEAKKRHNFRYIWDLINEANNKEIAKSLQSFDVHDDEATDEETHLKHYFKKTDELLKKYKFVYSYCTEPDHTMHLEGTDSPHLRELLKLLNDELENLVKNNPNTLFVLLADHGMYDIEQWFYDKDEEFLSFLSSPYLTIEGRFCSLFVKDEEGFINYYNSHDVLKNNFVLKTSKELLEEHTFGYGTPCDNFESYFGNYFLLANGNLSINDGFGPDKDKFKATHAGVRKEETEIYITIFND